MASELLPPSMSARTRSARWTPTPRLALALLLSLAVGGCFSTPPGADDTVRGPEGDTSDGLPSSSPRYGVERVLDGLDRPVAFAPADPDGGVLLIVEQRGRVRAWNVSTDAVPVVLDLGGRVSSEGERGLFAAVFPDAEAWEADHVFVHYTDRDGNTVLSAIRRQDGGEEARSGAGRSDVQRLAFDLGSEHVLLRVEQPYSNHNGGGMSFGPDGMLYLALGDGGAAADPHGHGQDPGTLLGSILRLEVPTDWDEVAGGYRVPDDNPFVGQNAAREEVWAYGLRNPWRISFDAATGDLWIADVGQNDVEEVNRQPGDSEGGENYGWNVWEGDERFRPGEAKGDVVFPVAAYPLQDGRCAVIGGHVHRGGILGLNGTYVFGDFCSGEIFGLRPDPEAPSGWRFVRLLDTDLRPTAFGTDGAGELYVADHGGSVHRLVAQAGTA